MQKQSTKKNVGTNGGLKMFYAGKESQQFQNIVTKFKMFGYNMQCYELYCDSLYIKEEEDKKKKKSVLLTVLQQQISHLKKREESTQSWIQDRIKYLDKIK